MGQIYFVTGPIGTLCDSLILTLAGWTDRFLQPCVPIILNNGTLYFDETQDAEYVNYITDGNINSFREIDYTNKLDKLEHLLKNTDKNIVLGNYDPKQQHIIKEHFHNTVTIGIDYTSKERDIVLMDLIKVNKFVNEGLDTSISKKELDMLAHKEMLIRKNIWDRYIPESLTTNSEYVIHAWDLYQPNKLIDFIEKIDGPRNEKQIDFYVKWLYNNIN